MIQKSELEYTLGDLNGDGKINAIEKLYFRKYFSNLMSFNKYQLKAADVNEDGVVDANDMAVIGDPNPDFTYGFQTRLEWKNISLSASFTGVYGNDILNTNIRYEQTPSRQAGNLRKDAYYNAWTPENRSNLYPSSTSNVKVLPETFSVRK